MRARLFLKRMAQGLSLVVVFVPSLICGFGHFSILFACFTQLFALVPGIPGVFWRAAFYKLTLEDCSIDSSIAFGTFFSSASDHCSICFDWKLLRHRSSSNRP